MLLAHWLLTLCLPTSLRYSRSSMTVHPLSSHITSAMLETSLSRAVHRFVVEDEETFTPRMVVSHPIELLYGAQQTANPTYTRRDSSGSSTPSSASSRITLASCTKRPSLLARFSIDPARIWTSESNSAWQPLQIFCLAADMARARLCRSSIDELLAGSEHETLIYPSRICSQLAELLDQSTIIYPRSQQRLGEWTVGWLLRR